MGKGSLWRVEQMQRQNLIQALNRSPFYQNSSADKINLKSPGGTLMSSNVNGTGAAASCGGGGYDVLDGCKSSSNAASAVAHINSRFDPNLFPNLSKAFKDISDVVPDVPDDEYPSDYSTTAKGNTFNTNLSSTPHKNNNNNSNNYNIYQNNSPISALNANGIGGADNSSTTCQTNNNSSSLMGTFSNYESIERLARDCGAESIEDVNAATAMLALKHGPKVFEETFQNG